MTAETPRTSNVFVVDRGEPKLRGGQGLLAGLGVVIRHFGKAFTKKIESPAESSGLFTVQYPEERLAMPEAYRNFPILLYDDQTGHELCTSCFQCERICPPQVIHMTQASDPTTGKPVPAVAEFIIEYDACMSCGLCAEVCPFDAIKMDHEFELSNADHSTMTVNKAGLDRPISYYESIAPTMWAEVRDGAMKKLQGNMKRRSGDIGIAPPMKGKVQTSAPAPAAAKPAAPAAPAKPVAAVGANMSDEKKARLEAIRAAKAAQAAQSGGATPEVAAPEASAKPVAAVGANMSDEKKARLEAIRAAKAAAKAAQEGGTAPEAPAPEAAAPAPEAPAKPMAAIGSNMSGEKKARLEAIRAAKAAAKAAQEGGAAPEAPAPEAAAPETAAPEAAAPAPEAPAKPVAAIGSNMSEEKRARLEAIRAAKAAAKREASNDES